MTQSKKVQFQIRKQDVTIDLHYANDYDTGVFWSYPDSPTSGPFKSEATAIEDAKLYSQYGTTSKHLLLQGTSRPMERRNYEHDMPGLSSTRYIRRRHNG